MNSWQNTHTLPAKSAVTCLQLLPPPPLHMHRHLLRLHLIPAVTVATSRKLPATTICRSDFPEKTHLEL
jgi:hypothetical protein